MISKRTGFGMLALAGGLTAGLIILWRDRQVPRPNAPSLPLPVAPPRLPPKPTTSELPKPAPGFPDGSDGHVFLGLSDGRLLVVDEVYDEDEPSRIWTLDLSTVQWHLEGHTITSQYECEPVQLSQGLVLLFGGIEVAGTAGGEGEVPVAKAELFDLNAGQSRQVLLPPEAHQDGLRLKLSDGRLLWVGGEKWNEQRDRFEGPEHSLLFDPSTLRWSLGPGLQIPRLKPACVELEDGTVVVWGGYFPPSDISDLDTQKPAPEAFMEYLDLKHGTRSLSAVPASQQNDAEPPKPPIGAIEPWVYHRQAFGGQAKRLDLDDGTQILQSDPALHKPVVFTRIPPGAAAEPIAFPVPADHNFDCVEMHDGSVLAIPDFRWPGDKLWVLNRGAKAFQEVILKPDPAEAAKR